MKSFIKLGLRNWLDKLEFVFGVSGAENASEFGIFCFFKR